MSLRPCLECGAPSEGNRCREHAAPLERADAKRRNAKTVAHGLRRAHWQRIRRRRLAMSGGYCELNLEGCTKIATGVHLDEAFQGDHDAATIDDARAACAHCHGVADGRRAHAKAAA